MTNFRKPVTFISAFLETLKGALFNRDTAVIYLIAVAFYHVYYAWPYYNQQILNIPVAVVDLDSSASSRHLIQELDASATIDLRSIVHSESEGMQAMKLEEVGVLVIIPSDYEYDLARSSNTSIHIFGSGSYPVKARAVQASVAALSRDTGKLLDMPEVFSTGLPGHTFATQAVKPPAVTVQYRFNTIGGYASFTVPAVSSVILQAVMLMGITTTLGGWLCRKERPDFVKAALQYPVRIGSALFFAFWLITYTWYLYIHLFSLPLYEFGSLQNASLTLGIGSVYAAAITAFGMLISLFLGSNRFSVQTVVTMSMPSVFLSGAIWPLENFVSFFVYGISILLPACPGIKAIVGASTDGAQLADIIYPVSILAMQVFVYTAFVLVLAKKRSETV